MYPTSGATLRGDINVLVEEAAGSDAFFIGDRVLPPFSVSTKSGQYPKVQIAAAELLSPLAQERERGGSYGEVSRGWTYDTYDCADRGLEEPLDDVDARDLSRFFNVEVAKARWTLRNIKLAQEVRVAAAVMNASNFGAGTNSAVAYAEANIATINFPLDVSAAVDRVNANGGNANTVVVSSTVWSRVRRATPTVNFVAGSVGAGSVVNARTMAQALSDYGITQVLVGRAQYNAAKKGQAKSMSSVWGTTYVWVGNVNTGAAALEEGGAGFILVWNAEGGLYVSETYRDEKRRSNMIRVRQNTIEKIVDGTAGTLITTQWA